MSAETRKYYIIEQIMKISEEAFLNKLEKMLVEFAEGTKSVAHLVKPMRKKLVIADLIKEQNFQGADKKVLDGLIEEAAIDEPLEELLASL